MKHLLLLLGIGLLTFPAHGWEPYSTDINQAQLPKQVESLDHLEPAYFSIPERDYLVHYACISDNRTFFLIEGGSHRFYLKKWEEKGTSDKKLDEAFFEIPEDIVTQVHTLWINALLEARYDRAAHSGDDGATEIFSVSIPESNPWQGKTWSPDLELPPKWLGDAAYAVILYAKDRDADKCRKTLAELHDKLFTYWKAHGRP